MVRMLCLAQAQPPANRRGRRKAAKAAEASATQQTFIILERAPVGQSHRTIWNALRRHGEKQHVIDSEFPQDAFQADVITLDRLSGDAIAAIASVLAERRAMTLAAQKDGVADDLLAKRWDKLFEQEMEWLAIRNLLATAVRRPRKGSGRRAARALLLIDV